MSLSLHIYSNALLQDFTSLVESANWETKPGLLKRGTREILSSIITGNYKEKQWIHALLQFLKTAMNNEDLPFDFPQNVITTLAEKFNIHDDPKQMLSTIQIVEYILNYYLACHPSSIEQDDTVYPEWFKEALALAGSLLDKLSGSARKPKALEKAVYTMRNLIVK